MIMKRLKKYIKIDKKNRHKVMTLGYAVAIVLAFVLALTNNSDVSASVSPNSHVDYLMLENSIANNITDSSTIYPENSIQNIRSLFEMVNKNEREKLIEKEIEVVSGDNFGSILSNAGLDTPTINNTLQKIKAVYDVRSLRVGQKIVFELLWDVQDDKLLSFEGMTIKYKADEKLVLDKDEKGELFARVEKDELIEEVNTATGVIDGHLSASMNAQGVPNRVVADFVNIFSFSIDFRRDVRKGDKFEIVYENFINPQGEVIKTGNVLYAGLLLGNARYSLYRFKDKSGNIDYYNEKGLAMKKTLHRKPLAFQNARISSPFGKRRHPIYKDLRIHWGVDYAAPRGTAVYAAGDGVVQMAQWFGGYGKYIKIRHNSEYSTAYGHLNAFAKGIGAGSRVRQGQIIAYVGNTGRSTGPHLHYEVVQNGRRVNPTTIKASAGENLAGENLKGFQATVASLKQAHQSLFADSMPEKVASATEVAPKAANK